MSKTRCTKWYKVKYKTTAHTNQLKVHTIPAMGKYRCDENVNLGRVTLMVRSVQQKSQLSTLGELCHRLVFVFVKGKTKW